jgi:hypothetical protein
LLSLAAIIFLVRIYNKYFVLEEILEVHVKRISENIDKINERHEEFLITVDKFIGVITTTDEISIKQKEQIDLLNKIVDGFRVKGVCESKEVIKNEDSDTLTLKKLLDLICEDYELHRKD